MKHFLLLLLASISSFSTCFSQQFWESEFHSNDEKLYRAILKNNKVKKIYTFYHYKKGAAAIPYKIYELDKNGNVLVVIKKADQDIKQDVKVEQNAYDVKGNIISHVEFNNSGSDTMKFVLYQYNSLNNLILETKKEGDYQVGKDDKLERIYKTSTYTYENGYDTSHILVKQLKKYNSNTVLRSEFSYDPTGNLIEIKRYLKETECLESWVKLSYYSDNSLKEKFYPNYSCGEGNHSKVTMNSNRYTYEYNPQKQFAVLNHTNLDQFRGKIVYTYNPTGLVIYIEPDDDFGYYDTSLKYEFYK